MENTQINAHKYVCNTHIIRVAISFSIEQIIFARNGTETTECPYARE
jgi:hypothetical protein